MRYLGSTPEGSGAQSSRGRGLLRRVLGLAWVGNLGGYHTYLGLTFAAISLALAGSLYFTSHDLIVSRTLGTLSVVFMGLSFLDSVIATLIMRRRK